MSGLCASLLHSLLKVVKFFEFFGTNGVIWIMQRTVWMAGMHSVRQHKVWSVPLPSPA